MINSITIKAVFRLDSRMMLYQIRRLLRNILARKFPTTYGKFVRSYSIDLPKIKLSENRPEAETSLVKFVSTFYSKEYESHIDQITSGRIEFFEQPVDFGSPANIDWHHKVSAETDFHLWRMKLGHMGFVCPMLISENSEHHTAVSKIIESYKNNSSFGIKHCFSSYWFPYSVSHRVLAILSGLVVARSKHSLPLQLIDTLTDFLRFNIAFLLLNIEHELKNNHVERNLAAICLYFTHAEAVPSKIARMVDKEVYKIVSSTVLNDGLLAERSAMYQGLTVMALNVFSNTPFLSKKTLEFVNSKRVLAERAWAFMTHPDSEIALFNDSWIGEVPPPATVIKIPRFNNLDVLKDSGYARLQNETFFVLFDAGAIGPNWNPGHGHADFLSVEMDVFGRRFIVDPGTYQYSTGVRRMFERSSASHNGPTWAGAEPIEYYGCFKVGKLREAKFIKVIDNSDCYQITGTLEVEHGTIYRSISLTHEALEFRDEWTGQGNTRTVRLIIQGEWHLESFINNTAIFENSGIKCQISVLIGNIENVQKGEWSRYYLHSENSIHLIMNCGRDEVGSNVLKWIVKATQPA